MIADPDPAATDTSAERSDVRLRAWQHDVNNALNAAMLATHVAGVVWSMGDAPGAAANLERAYRACARLQCLLEEHPAWRKEAERE